MEMPDVQRYGHNLFVFVVGSALRVLVLAGMIVYIVGEHTMRSAFAQVFPSLSDMTSPKVESFMKLYGLSTLMPLIVLVIVVAAIHAGNALIFGIANRIPPRFSLYPARLLRQAVDEHLLKDMLRRLEDATCDSDLEELQFRIGEVLAESRLAQPENELLDWANSARASVGSAHGWIATLKTYLLVALALGCQGAAQGSPGRMVRGIESVVALIVLLVLASVIMLQREKARAYAEYMTARSILMRRQSWKEPRRNTYSDPLPRYGRWWSIKEVDDFMRLVRTMRNRHTRHTRGRPGTIPRP